MALEYDFQHSHQSYRPKTAAIQGGSAGGGWQIVQLERYVRTVMRWGIMFALGWASSAAYYQVSHLWAQKAILTKEVRCEHTRAQGAIASVDNDQQLPNYVTRDCPHGVK